MFAVIVKGKVVHRTNDWKEALKAVKEVFNRGFDDVILSGGKIGSWR